MDHLDFSFRKNMVTRKGSAEARRDKLSFLQELTPEQMASYRPDQIATILRQREEVRQHIFTCSPGSILIYVVVKGRYCKGGTTKKHLGSV